MKSLKLLLAAMVLISITMFTLTGFAAVGQDAGFGVDANGVSYARYWDATGNWFEQYVYGANTWTLWIDVDGAGTSYTPGDENGDYYFQYTGVDANGTQIEDWQYYNDGVTETRESYINNLTGFYDLEYEYQDFSAGGQYRQLEIYNDPFSNTSYNYDAWFVDYNLDGNLQNDWMKWSWDENFAAVSGYTQNGVVEVNFLTNYAYGTIFEQNVNSGSYEIYEGYGWDTDGNGFLRSWNGEYGFEGGLDTIAFEFDDIGMWEKEGYSANDGHFWQDSYQWDYHTDGGQYEIKTNSWENIYSGEFSHSESIWFDADGDNVQENDWYADNSYDDYYAYSYSYSLNSGLSPSTGNTIAIYNPEQKSRFYTNSWDDGRGSSGTLVNYVADADGDGTLEWATTFWGENNYEVADDYNVTLFSGYNSEDSKSFSGSLEQVDGNNNMDMYSVNWQFEYDRGNGSGDSESWMESANLNEYEYEHIYRDQWSQSTETENINIDYGFAATRTYTSTSDSGPTVSETGIYYDFDSNTTYANTGENYNSSDFEVREETVTSKIGVWESYSYGYYNYTGSGRYAYNLHSSSANTENGDTYRSFSYDDIISGLEYTQELYTAGGSITQTQGTIEADYYNRGYTANYIWVPAAGWWYLLNITPYDGPAI
jgi:hypothetical protein